MVSKSRVFIKVEKYEEILSKMDDIKEKIDEMEEKIKKINDLRSEEQKDIELWNNKIKEIKDRLDRIDKGLFED